MALIRSQKAAPLIREAVVLDLGDLSRQADLLRQQARDQADATLQTARTQALSIKETAQKEGYESGLAKGLEVGKKLGIDQGRESAQADFHDRLTQLENAWKTALDEFLTQRHTMLTNLQHDLILLATRMARAIVNRTIKTHPEVVVDQVASTIDRVSHRSALTIRIHPDEHELIESSLPDLLKRMKTNADARVVPDDSIARGGCVIDAQGVEVDADLDTQIARLVDALLPDDGSGRRPSEMPSTDDQGPS